MLTSIITDSVAYGRLTQTADTVIRRLIRPFRGARTRITGFKYTAAGTAHTLIVKPPIGTTTLSAAAAAGQAVIVLTAAPTAARAVATSDFLVVERKEAATGRSVQTWELYQVHGSTAPTVNSDGTVSVTLSANVAGAHLAGQRVWLMALSSDTVPGYNLVPPTFTLTASVATELPSNALAAAGGIAGSWNDYEPLVVESNNATAAGVLEYVTAVGFIPAAGRHLKTD